MTQARSHLIPPNTPCMLHCVQRCVRRAFLCGLDQDTGRCFEHRKHWVEDRIHFLADSFAVAIHAYAVMSNHLHLVVQIDPAQAMHWSDIDLADRWIRLFPPREDTEEAWTLKRQCLISNPERMEQIRHRLGSLSWLMRCLAEPIARRANREDGCTGRFWEGRFKAQVLCDERALLAAMAYVDLNPIRAGTTKTLHASKHTAVKHRIAQTKSDRSLLNQRIKPVAGAAGNCLSITTIEYFELLEWTRRQISPDKKHRVAASPPSILRLLEYQPERWSLRVKSVGSGYWRVVGEASDLIETARRLGQSWMKGIRLAARLSQPN